MAIGIDDLDDDGFGTVVTSQNEEGIVSQTTQQTSQEDDFMADYLKSKGIEDYNKIKFDEDGEIVERSWNDLSKEEKFNILNTPLQSQESNEGSQKEEDNNDLTQDEISFINYLRENNLTPQQYAQQIAQNGQGEQEPVYRIDDLSDDEVFLLDLESRVGELSDDEAAQALNNAKQNEDFYKKQVEGIRKEYKEREDFRNQQEQATLEEQQRVAFEEYKGRVVDAIDNFNSIGNLDLNFEDKDKEELAEFMLSQDENGGNYLYQALQDPETLTKAAWFILNGEEAFNSVADYFTTEIKRISEAQYKKGLEDGKKGVSSKPTVVIDKSNNKTNLHRPNH